MNGPSQFDYLHCCLHYVPKRHIRTRTAGHTRGFGAAFETQQVVCSGASLWFLRLGLISFDFYIFYSSVIESWLLVCKYSIYFLFVVLFSFILAGSMASGFHMPWFFVLVRKHAWAGWRQSPRVLCFPTYSVRSAPLIDSLQSTLCHIYTFTFHNWALVRRLLRRPEFLMPKLVRTGQLHQVILLDLVG